MLQSVSVLCCSDLKDDRREQLLRDDPDVAQCVLIILRLILRMHGFLDDHHFKSRSRLV
eukprot:SAG31_NODE_35314_length_324_cov_0.924444_1_plen_58_part_01